MTGFRGDSVGYALEAVVAAAARAGLNASAATVLRVRCSVHVELPHADVIARVEQPGGLELAERQVAVARVLAAHDAPVARLVRPDIQPILSGDAAVTFWHRLRPVGTPTVEAVGRAIRAIHDTTRDRLPGDVAAIDPLGLVGTYLDSLSSWSGSVAVKELRRRADELAAIWMEVCTTDPLGSVIVHGDAHLDNAVRTTDGVVLLDLEDAGIGPASWDFAAMTLGVERYGMPPEDLEGFLRGYGATLGVAGEIMRDVYELMVTAWAIRSSVDSPRLAEEAAVRVAGVLDGDPTHWTLL